MSDPMIISLTITCGIALTLAILGARNSHRPAAKPFIFFMLGAAIWSLGNLIEISATQANLKLFAIQFEYIGIVLIPTNWFLIALIYTGQSEWISFKKLAVLAIIPLATVILAWTNAQHHLLWVNVDISPGILHANWLTIFKPLFWVHALYSYGLLLAANLILIKFSFSSPKYYQFPILALVSAISLPMVANLLFITSIFRPFQIDPTPAIFAVSGCVIAWILFRKSAFKNLPISYHTIINNLSAAIIILDMDEQIISFNPAANQMIDDEGKLYAGQLLEHAVQALQSFYNGFQVAKNTHHEVIWQHEHNHNYYEMLVRQLTDSSDKEIGEIIINHQISAYINTQKAVEESELKYRTLFESTNECIFIEDLAGNILDCNAAACETYDYTLSEFQAINVTELVPDEQHEALMYEFKTILEDQEIVKESLGRRKDGSVFPSKVRSRLMNISGEPRLVVHVRDISEEKAAKQKITERLAITETLYDISRTLISIGTLDTALQSILAKVAQVLNSDRVSLILLDTKRETILKQFVGGEGKSHIEVVSYQELMNGLTGWCLREARPAISDGCQPDARESASVRQRRIKTQSGSILVAPLLFQTKKLGTITAIKRSDQNQFTLQDQELLVAIANQAAIVIENNRLLDFERKQREQAETLRETTSAIVSTLDQEEAIERILVQLEKVIPYDSASVQIYEDHELVIVGGRGWLDQDAVIGMRFPIPGDNPNTLVIETRQPYFTGSASIKFPGMQTAQHQPIRSWLGVPLIVHEHLIGVLVLDHHKENFYNEEDSHLVSLFADQVAIAIENARMYMAEQGRVRQLDALRATMTDISSELELSKLLRAILIRAIGLLNASGGDLALYQENQNDLVIVASHNMGIDRSGNRLDIGEGILGKVAASLQPLLLNNYPNWLGRIPNLPDEPWQAALATPLLIGGRLVGCIGIVDLHQKRKFTQDDQKLLNLFAQQAAIAVENARLYQSAREAAERRAILHSISQEIVTANLEPENIYFAIHKAASQLTVCESFVISLVDYEKNEIEAVYLVDRGGRTPSRRVPIEQGLSGYVLQTGRSLNIPDLENPATPVQGIHFGSKDTVRSVLAVPMRLGNQVMGVLSTQSYSPFAYSSEDQYLIEMLASYAAIALSNTYLFQTVQQLAITDPLTGIFNRRHLFELGQREFFRALRFKRPITAIMIDIDHFKRVNDNFGHATGDEVLIELAQRMQAITRDIDILARYGGEEFTILVPETNAVEAIAIAERIRKEISHTPFTARGFLFNISISLGIASNHSGTPDLAALIDLADQALYDAKHAGRNRIAVR